MRVLYAGAVYGREEIDPVSEVLESSSHALMVGRRVDQFENGVSSLFGKQFGVIANSGSSANTIAVKALGLG